MGFIKHTFAMLVVMGLIYGSAAVVVIPDTQDLAEKMQAHNDQVQEVYDSMK